MLFSLSDEEFPTREEWPEVWPKEAGRYWAYGRRSVSDRQPMLGVLEVHAGANGPTYVLDGNFFYKSEAGRMLFKPLPQPRLPENF